MMEALERASGASSLCKPEDLVCQLNKFLYGLKQAPRVWNRHFDYFMQKFGLKLSAANTCIYIHQQREFTITCIFDDDGHICSNSKDAISNILKYLNNHIKSRSHFAEQFAGRIVSRDRIAKKLFLSQTHYIKKK